MAGEARHQAGRESKGAAVVVCVGRYVCGLGSLGGCVGRQSGRARQVLVPGLVLGFLCGCLSEGLRPSCLRWRYFEVLVCLVFYFRPVVYTCVYVHIGWRLRHLNTLNIESRAS